MPRIDVHVHLKTRSKDNKKKHLGKLLLVIL